MPTFNRHLQKWLAAAAALVISLCGFTTADDAQTTRPSSSHPNADPSTDMQRVPPVSAVAAMLQALPLRFEMNAGQFNNTVRFAARGKTFSVSVSENEAAFAFCPRDTASSAAPVQLRMVGSRITQDAIRGENELSGRTSYLIGNDPAGWHKNVRQFERVSVKSLYPNIDMVYYGTNQSELEYDFIVAPGGNPADIRLQFENVSAITVDPTGALSLETPCGTLRQHRPTVYQSIDGERRAVSGAYEIAGGNTARFIIGEYDHTKQLVIDPVVSAASYLGGTGSDDINALDVDSDGDLYVTGYTPATDFPVTTNALQKKMGGSWGDVFVAKITQKGTKLEWATYLGGKDTENARGIAVDSHGAVWVGGFTGSSDFPFVNAIQNKIQVNNDMDGFVAKLSADGSAVEFSTLMGGPVTYGGSLGVADSVQGIAVDKDDNAYAVSALTVHGQYMNPAFITGGIASDYSDEMDAFVVKFSPTGKVLYGTYLGLAAAEAHGIDVDGAGNAYIVGNTVKALGVPTFGTYKGGSNDAFVVKVNPTGTARVFAIDVGGSGRENCWNVRVSGSGEMLIGGTTDSSDYPTTATAYQKVFHGGYDDAFLTKFNAAGNSIVYSTYLGGSSQDQGFAVDIDSDGSMFISGDTDSPDFPTVRPFHAPTTFYDRDIFIAKFNSVGDKLLYSSTYGGSPYTDGGSVKVGGKNVFIAGYTESKNIPLKNPFQPTMKGMRDGFIMRIGEAGMYLR
ncbi:MAG: SBBP repeat-containing protein [Bdellovibrionota bacterium]